MMNVYYTIIMEPANGFRKEEITSTWPEMMMMTSQAVELIHGKPAIEIYD